MLNNDMEVFRIRDYIPIDKEDIPQRFQIDLGEETFAIEIHYNEIGEFFTIDLYDSNDEILVLGEKLILGVPLWADITNSNLPAPTIIPLDESASTDCITYDNFGKTVFLFIDDIDEEGEEFAI